MKRIAVDPRVLDDAYAGTLLAQWAMATGYLALGITLLLLDTQEIQRFRVADTTVPWPAPGFWVRAIGAGLVLGWPAIPFFYWYMGLRERPALRKTLETDPSQATGVLNYVGNVGVAATSLGLASGVVSLALLFADQVSRHDSALQRFEFSPAVWLGGATTLLSVLAMLGIVRWRRSQYASVIAGESALHVSPARSAPAVWFIVVATGILLFVLIIFSFLPVFVGWERAP
jgi:hypothetical protein